MATLRHLAANPYAGAGLAFVIAVLFIVARRRTSPWQPWRLAAIALSSLVGATGLWLGIEGYDWRFVRDLVRFQQPLFLAFPALVAIFALWRMQRLPTGITRGRRIVMGLCASLAALCAALAVAGPEWGHPIDRLTVVLAIDRSRSMELVGNATARVHEEESHAVASMRDDDRIARVVFGAEAATEDPAHPRAAVASAQDVAVGADGTDVGAAIRRALAEIPDESAGRVVLVTDGAANRGDALGAAAAASASGVPIDVVRLEQRPQPNIRLEAVRAPIAADEGEAFDLRVVTRSNAATDVDVRVSIDGQVVQRGRAHIEAGEDVVTLRQTAPTSGLHRYEVDVTPTDPHTDAIVQDNRAGTFLRVRGPSRVLVLEGDPGRASPLIDALRQAAFRTEERSAASFPEDLAALASYDLVVLSDVPARDLTPDQMSQMATYVRDLGGGLLLMGGDRSMGPGGYSRTPIEEISPVAFDMRQERRRASLAQVIAIDFSGSMAMTVSTGQTKLALANEASARSAMLLGPGDRLGVMHVDTTPHWTIPIQPIGGQNNVQSIVERIRAVGPSGGGIIIPVTLTEAYRALGQQNANLRHLLLFADGSDSEEIQGQWQVVQQAFRQGITTSVVSLGRGSDTPELEHLSREGHGRFYLVEDAMRLPAVFAQETVLAARSSIREEPFRPHVAAPDTVTRGIDFEAGPALRGWVVTIPKPRASILLTGVDNDPILATWQIGVGRVAAFMSDAKDRWGQDWLTWPEAPRMWAELARSIARRADPLVRVDADTVGGVLHVHADARTADGYADSLRRLTARVTGPDGRVRELALDPVGAGTYGADLTLDRPGAYALGVRDDPTSAIVANGGAILLEGEELRPPTDPQLLERVVSMTGGRMRGSLTDLFNDRVGLRRAYTPLTPFLMYAAAALMFLALLARRLAMPDAVSRWLDARSAAAKRVARERSQSSVAAETTVGALVARRREAKEAKPAAKSGASASVPSAPTFVPPAVTPSATQSTVAPKPAAKPADAAPAEPAKPQGTGSSNLDALLAKKRSRK